MKYLTLLLLVSASFFSCDSDDESTNANPELNGIWNLTFVSCECTPVDLEIGEHTWDINLNNSTVVVQNNVTEELHTLPASGTYSINVTDTTFTILDIDFEYYFIDNDLILEDEPEVDGPRITFERS